MCRHVYTYIKIANSIELVCIFDGLLFIGSMRMLLAKLLDICTMKYRLPLRTARVQCAFATPWRLFSETERNKPPNHNIAKDKRRRMLGRTHVHTLYMYILYRYGYGIVLCCCKVYNIVHNKMLYNVPFDNKAIHM